MLIVGNLQTSVCLCIDSNTNPFNCGDDSEEAPAFLTILACDVGITNSSDNKNF